MDFLKDVIKKVTGGESGKINSAEAQTKEEKELVSFIDNRLQESRNSSSRVAQEGNWMTNYAYLIGYAGVAWNNQYKQFQTTGSQNSLSRNRITVNKILPSVQRKQARLGKNPPKYEVRPDDAGQDARDMARLEKSVLEQYFDRERIVEKYKNMLVGLQQCGHYYLGVSWNPEKGDLLQAEKKEVSDNGEERVVPDYEYQGDIEVSLESPFTIFPDPLAKSLDTAQWYIHAKVKKLDYFKSKYPERGYLVKEENTDITSLQYDMRIQSLTGQGPAQTGIVNQQQNTAVEKVYYEKRSRKHPHGRMVIIANGVLLTDTELPCGEFPHVMFADMLITDRYYPEATVTHLRPIQDQFNRTIQKRADWLNKMLAGKWQAPKGSQLQQEAITNSSGEVVYFTPIPNTTQGVQQMQVPVIPEYAYKEEESLNANFSDIMGEGDVSRGILPSASIPAIGMELLLEQDETRMSAITSQHEEAFSRVGQLILKYAEEYITDERMLKQSDPNMQYVIKKYSGDSLKSKHDVIVVKGSLAPTSTAVKRNDILNLYREGLLGDPADPAVRAKVLQWLEFGDIASVWTQQSIDMSQIKKSIAQIEQGEIPEVHEMDNHSLHIQQKNDYRKSDKFNQLETYKQAIFEDDIEIHLKWLQKLTSPQFGMTPDAEDEVGMRAESMESAINQADQMAMAPQGTPAEAGAQEANFQNEVTDLE